MSTSEHEMNQATKNVLTLTRFYKIATAIVADVLAVRDEGVVVYANLEPTTGVLSAAIPARRESRFWTLPETEQHLQNLRHHTSNRWARHVNLLLPGAAVQQIDFHALAVDVFARMTRMLCENEREPEPEPLPDVLTVDWNARERDQAARERRASVEFVGELAKRDLLDALHRDAMKVLGAGTGHTEEHTNKVDVTDDHVSINLSWQHARDKSIRFDFSADSDTIGDRLCDEWAQRNYPNAAPWCQRGYGTDQPVSLVRKFEPTGAEWRGIARQILLSLARNLNLKVNAS